MNEIEELRAEVAKLREEIAALRLTREVHHHHYTQPSITPAPMPYNPYGPSIPHYQPPGIPLTAPYVVTG